MSASSVMPAGSKRMLVNFATYVSSGTPYCSAIDTDTENASITPASVELCFDISLKGVPETDRQRTEGGLAGLKQHHPRYRRLVASNVELIALAMVCSAGGGFVGAAAVMR